ncbi:MAG: FAD-dependent oxidoreductase [Spirochaetales bacterium]|nr:FAD-dependent oxidoreductase [Spirochaetales bacterium]
MKWDVVIIGAGVAGLSAAHYSRFHNLSTLLVEQVSPGGQAMNIVHVPNYPGVDASLTGAELVLNMETRAQELGTEFLYTPVETVHKESDGFILDVDDGTIEAKRVILATGTIPRTLEIPGAQALAGRGISNCAPCDGPFFRNKPTAVIGGGDSALEDALFLSQICPEVHVVVRDSLTAQPYLLEQLRNSPSIKVHLGKEIASFDSLVGPHGFPVLQGLVLNDGTKLEVAGLFVLIGSTPRIPKVEPLSPATNAQGFLETDRWNETSVSGLFAVGGVRDQGFSQIIVGAADGALAARRVYFQLLPTLGKE